MIEIPVVDVGPLLDASAGEAHIAATGAAIDSACQEFGFFYITGHGVDRELREQLDNSAREFFALPDEEKAEIAMDRAGSAWRGWFPVGGELTSGVPDLKEGIYFGAELDSTHPRVRSATPLHGANLFPRRPVELRGLVLTYLQQLTILGQAILEGMAVALGLQRSWFADNLTTDPLILFRIFHYPPALESAEGEWGVGEHTDYGLLTILGQDDHGGLQVRTPSGWIDAPPLSDSFVCNLGDMLERLTGGRYRSTPHRVRNASAHDRLSFPFFLDPAWDAVVDRLPIVDRPVDDGAAADRWDHANVHGFEGTYGEYVLRKVAHVFPDLADGVHLA